MADTQNGDWHAANGGGLPYRRPPTVDEALPYSPFTSIIPFSPDIIPFPTAEPPTPPSTLTPIQRNDAKQAISILNDEIKDQSTAQHLHDTLQQLRELLLSDTLPEYNFKPMAQTATPPPDSPPKGANGSASNHNSKLSPFASMLLRQTDVSFTSFDIRASEPLRKSQASIKHVAPSPQARATSQSLPQPTTPNNKAFTQNVNIPFPSSALSSVPSSTPVRPPGPAVVIKPKAVPRDDYVRYDTIGTSVDLSQKKQDKHRAWSDAAALRPHEREIAERKTEELESLVASLEDDRDDIDGSTCFTAITTPEGEFKVLNSRSMESLTSQVLNVVNLGRLANLPVDFVMQIQSLTHPTIVSTTKNGLFSQDDDETGLAESIKSAEASLKAARLILDTMIEGRDDYRLRREEIIDVLIDLLKLVKDTCTTPVLQATKAGEAAGFFSAAWAERKKLQAILRLCGSVLGRFATLIGKYNLPDRARNTLEYMTLELLLDQNSDTERDSIFGIARFERFRQRAMDVLAQLFAQHAEQRQSILNGIMSNLEKLPHKKASARQFQSAHEVPIMTISAAFMRFVHVSATNRKSSTSTAAGSKVQEVHDDESSDYEPGTVSQRSHKRNAGSGALQIGHDLVVNASQIANHIVTSLVSQAKGVSKTGDKPFRNLLDLFVDDFCNVFGSPEWPAAALLLKSLLAHMEKVLQGNQSSVNDKDMALAIMARIGCGIIDFKQALRDAKRKLDISQSNLSSRLDHFVDDAMSEDLRERVNDADLLAFDGPYRMVIESLGDYLDLKTSPDDPHLQSVSGCHISFWLCAVIQAFSEQDEEERPQVIKDVQRNLESILVDPTWLARKYTFEPVSDVQSRLAAGIITLQSDVRRFLPHIITRMVMFTKDKDFPRLRTKGFTGLEQLIEKDPRVIDEQTVLSMLPSLKDSSPSVRDSTLKLIARCVELDPSLERHVLPFVINMTTDDKPAPRKRAIKLAKDIYLGPTAKVNRLHIAAALLLPTQDHEKTISELTRNILEEIWFTTAATNTTADDSKVKLRRAEGATFMVDIVVHLRRQPTPAMYLEAFEKFLIYALSPESRNPTANLGLCKELITDLVDEVISPESQSNKGSQARIMYTLSLFAKAKAALFTTEQVQLLKLYIKDATTIEEISLLQPTVIVLRHTLPSLPVTQHAFAEDVRVTLMRNIARLAQNATRDPDLKNTLDDVVHCLWTISTMPRLGMDRIVTTVASVLCQLKPHQTTPKERQASLAVRISTYLILLGVFGKICNFSQYADTFWDKVSLEAQKHINKMATEKQMEPFLKAKMPPSRLLLDVVRPFTMQSWDTSIREHALWSLGGICQQSPELFMRAEVEKVIKLIFINDDTDSLKRISLSFFKEYFTFAERRSETGAKIAIGKGAATGSARLETSFVANENDSATLHLAQNFLSNFVDTALQTDTELAELASSVVASISRQGLVHPKECGAALVALATSRNKKIAEMAATEHKRIHEKQESYLEKEYMQAIRMTFKYQCDVFSDPHGMLEATYSPKLVKLFDALKAGAKATFKKFVTNFCKQVDFNFSKLDASKDAPEALLFARFCLENLALLDFQSMDVLAVFLNAVDAIVFKTTGPTVALAIESEMSKQFASSHQLMEQDPHNQQMQDVNGFPVTAMPLLNPPPSASQVAPPAINDARLREITVACMILQMIWETHNFVRRCYNLQKLSGRIHPKDTKEAKRNNLVSGKELWERLSTVMHALDTRDTMIKQCYDFADLLEVDREHKINEDELDDMGLGGGYETPGEDGEDATPVPASGGGRGRKRKGSASLHNTPKKARGRPAGAKNKKRNSRTPEGDGDSD